MFFKFLSHQWISFWRGRNQGGGIAARIVMTLLILYILVVSIAAGFLLKELLTNFFPGRPVIHVFNSIILYYFMVDILMRFQLQELPILSIQPYLNQNIRKKTIIGFLNTRSLFYFLNFLPLIIFLPFILRTIAPSHSWDVTTGYIIAILSITCFNNFLTQWMKRHSSQKAWIPLVGVLLIIAFAALDYFKIISVSAFSDRVFTKIGEWPWLSVIFIIAAAVMVRTNNSFLAQNLYLEELNPAKAEKIMTNLPFFDRFGRVGELAGIELKLILRNKRSKGALIMSAFFLFYGFFFYKPELLDSNRFSTMLFAAIFITGIFQVSYGQFMFAWQSSHFDGLMASKISYRDFIKSKFLLFNTAATIITLISLLYGLISWKLILLHISVYLYNIGFGSVIVLFFANFNKKRLDLTKKATFNWQGVGMSQWLMGIPLIVLPFLIYIPFGATDRPFWGVIAIGIFGLITLGMQDLWIRWLTKLFIKQRYSIAEGFRE